MAFAVNKVILLGNLGADPEVKYLDSGTAIANLSIATSDSYKDRDGEWQEKTEWHRVVIFGKIAEAIEEGKLDLRKGSKVYVEGKLQTRKYEKDGEDRYITEVVGFQVIALASGNGDSDGRNSKKKSNPKRSQRDEPITDDDIPF